MRGGWPPLTMAHIEGRLPFVMRGCPSPVAGNQPPLIGRFPVREGHPSPTSPLTRGNWPPPTSEGWPSAPYEGRPPFTMPPLT